MQPTAPTHLNSSTRLTLRTGFCVLKMSLHVPMTYHFPSACSALSFQAPSPVLDELVGPIKIPIIQYKHASKWNAAIYKQSDPFTVTFDTRGMTGCGVQYRDLTLRSAAIMNAVIVCGGEPVCFPHPGRKIQFRIVVRCVGHFCNTVDGSPDAYMLLRYSGRVMAMSIFPPPSTFMGSQSANWLEESRLSTLSSSK